MSNFPDPNSSRRAFLQSAAALAALRGLSASPVDDAKAVQAEVEKHRDENVRCLQTWIGQPSIAAEMLRAAGFGPVFTANIRNKRKRALC